MGEFVGVGNQPEVDRSEEHTSEPQSPCNLVCRLLLEKKTTAPTTQWGGRAGWSRLSAPAGRCHARSGDRPNPALSTAARPGFLSPQFSRFFFLMIRVPPRSTLFPTPAVFR